MTIDIESILTKLVDFAMLYGPRLIGAIIVWLIGSFIIKKLTKAIERILTKQETDSSLRPFLISLVRVLLKVLLLITVLSMLGVAMTSFIAILGAAGLAVGLALSGTLQNFAGGVVLLLFKPFKVGDYIEAQGHNGVVKEIQIFNTILTELDNKTVILPNAALANGSILNYTTEKLRRVDFSFGIAYGDNVAKAREVLNILFEADDRILKNPESFIGVGSLGDSSVNITARVWVEVDNYWGVFFDLNEKVYNSFNAEGINIPFPQMDVHLHKK